MEHGGEISPVPAPPGEAAHTRIGVDDWVAEAEERRRARGPLVKAAAAIPRRSSTEMASRTVNTSSLETLIHSTSVTRSDPSIFTRFGQVLVWTEIPLPRVM